MTFARVWPAVLFGLGNVLMAAAIWQWFGGAAVLAYGGAWAMLAAILEWFGPES